MDQEMTGAHAGKFMRQREIVRHIVIGQQAVQDHVQLWDVPGAMVERVQLLAARFLGANAEGAMKEVAGGQNHQIVVEHQERCAHGLQKDLREFIALLNSTGVRYLLVGGHAVAFHGYPRFTRFTSSAPGKTVGPPHL